MTPDCDLCGDTGWITRVDEHGDGWEVPCPYGCRPATGPSLANEDYEVPF
jgi:hypothetical protein